MIRFYFCLFIAYLLSSYQAYGQYRKLSVSTHINFSKYVPERGTLAEGVSGSEEKAVVLTPRATFRINKIWALGAVYQYKRTNQKVEYTLYLQDVDTGSPMAVSVDGKTINQRGGIFVQTYLYDNGKIAAFLEMDGTKGTSKTEMSLADGNMNQGLSAKHDIYSSGLHAGGRYDFFKGLGVEVRLNGLVQYDYLKAKDIEQKSEQFYLFDNFWNNCSVGISYQF